MRPRAARLRALLMTLPVAVALALGGCAAPRPPAPVVTLPPPAPRPKPGYEHLVDSLGAVDASGLEGRRIAIDPGHGGVFQGAVGVEGTTEKEVNLDVALALRDLLVAHGAQVFMTRETDRDFLSPADSSLRADLAERTRLANAFHPDVFLSIHHNADAGGAHDVQETQSYYKLGDEGVSLDAAQDVHRSLVRNIGIERNRVLPGNYYVLRSSEGPGLLTESSYITYPETEARLRTPEGQRLEAGALYIGLARWFARPTPTITLLAAHDVSVPGEDSLYVRGEPVIVAEVRGAFDATSLLVDGVPVTAMRTDSALAWRPPAPWSNGTHDVLLRVRMSGVGAARDRRLRFTVARPLAAARAEVVVAPRPGAPGALRIALLDRAGMPFVDVRGDSTPVRVTRTSAGIAPADTTVIAHGGVAWAYVRTTGTARTPVRVRIAAGSPATARTEIAVPRAAADPRAPWTGFVRAMPGDTVLRVGGADDAATAASWGAPIDRAPSINRDGFAVLARDSSGRVRGPAIAGCRRWGASDALPPRYVAIAGGALRGHRIMIDPEGGGQDSLVNGPDGTRAAFVNLETARMLAALLRAAGADVGLTREGDAAVSDVERVQRSEAFHAERFVRIGHRAGRPRLGYYFSSVAGKRWAQRTALAFTRLGRPEPLFGEDAQYVVQQVSAVALSASPASITTDAPWLASPGALRAEAWALFAGLAREWTDADWAADSLELHDAAGAPVPGAAITLGGGLVTQTGADGRAHFLRTEPGPLEVVVDDPRVRLRTTLLESSRGSVLTGCCSR